jgi:Tol biopolymer transport system component
MPETVERLRAALADRYVIDRELGAGGMATVYLADDVKHRRQVAVKVLNSGLAAAVGPERFLREIEIAARLHHPHILPLYDSGEADGFLYFVMPLVEGASLRDRLDREQQLPLDDALRITREVADALGHAHSQGIIHRDIKPENILLESGHAVVADFGIARAISAAGGQTLTGTGMAIGTPAYMSPEQAAGGKNLDGRSDLYALGCVLYEMLAGQPPFTGPTGDSVIRQHMAAEPPDITTIRPAVPASVAAALRRALAKTPADRFPNAAAFPEALAAPEARRAPMRVPKRALLLGGAVVVVLAGAALWLAMRLNSGEEVRARGEPTPTQATFTGNTYGPALSPDGRQLAYGVSAESCTPANCTTSVVVENLGLGERKVLAEGFTGGIYRLTWSPDGQFLLLTGSNTGDRGLTLLSLFGGRVQNLGHYRGGQFLGGSDTIITGRASNSIVDGNIRGATRWFPLLSRDGRRLDSIPFTVPGLTPWPIPSPDGRRILIWSAGDDPQGYYLIDRSGRLTDSLPSLTTLSRFYGHNGLQWTPTGDGVLAMVGADSTAPDVWTMLRFPVSANGRVRLPPDTVFARFRLPGLPDVSHRGGSVAMSPPSRNGDHAIGLLTATYALSTLERPSIAAPPARKAQLITGATGGLGAVISPDGERILVARMASLDGRPATQFEVWPFSGGTGTPLGPPRLGRLLSMTWSADGSSISCVAAGSAPGLLEHTRIEVASGRALQTRIVPDSLDWDWRGRLNRDSLLLYRSAGSRWSTPQELRTFPQDGGNPLVFTFPDSARWVNTAFVSPDGQGSWLAAMITSDEWGGDTVYTLHVSRPGVPAKRVMKFSGPWSKVTLIHAAAGPTFEVVADLLSGGRRWLLLRPGRPPRDLGPIPLREYPSLSADGRRGVVVETEQHRDIWLLKWPGGEPEGRAQRPVP